MIQLRRFIEKYGGALEVELRPQGIDLARDLGSRRFTYGACLRYLEHTLPDGPLQRQIQREKGVDPDAPSLEAQLLRATEYATSVVAWLNTDGKGQKPQPIELPGDKKAKRAATKRMDGRDYAEVWAERVKRREAELQKMREDRDA
jgi:hypothetical protein